MSIHEFVQYDHTYNFTKQAQSQKTKTKKKHNFKTTSLEAILIKSLVCSAYEMKQNDERFPGSNL